MHIKWTFELNINLVPKEEYSVLYSDDEIKGTDKNGFIPYSEWEYELPARYVVCERCEGKGKHDHPAFSNGITSEEWDRDWGYEERENYLRGFYDVRCEECKGQRVVLELDEDSCNPILRDAYYQSQYEKALWEQEEKRARELGY